MNKPKPKSLAAKLEKRKKQLREELKTVDLALAVVGEISQTKQLLGFLRNLGIRV